MAERVSERTTDGGLIPRAGGDDVIVFVRMRRASFEALSADPAGRSVPVSAGMIGLVADAPEHFTEIGEVEVWTFAVWSADPVWSAAGDAIPGNQASIDALEALDNESERRQTGPDPWDDEDEWR